MRGGDGGSPLGLSMWEGRTNTVIRNTEYDNAAWVGFGTFLPTVTANHATSPDGTVNADRVVFPATASGQRSILYQASNCPVGTDSLSCFFRGTSGSGTLDMGYNDASNGWFSRACPFVSTSWTRCLAESVSVGFTGGGGLFAFGNMTLTNGDVARAESDVLVYGCQCEAGRTASPVIITAGTATARAPEVARAAYTGSTTVSLGATVTPGSFMSDFLPAVASRFDAGSEQILQVVGAKNYCKFTYGPSIELNSPGNFSTPSPSVSACSYKPSARRACSAGACLETSGLFDVSAGAHTLYIGGSADGGAINAVVRSVCADPLVCDVGFAAPACGSSAAQKVALIGDSIMVGNSEVKVVDVVNGQLCPSGRAADSFAVGGSLIANCANQYHTSVRGTPYRSVATNCGINDLLGGATVNTAFAAIESLADAITRDAGYHLILGNLTPCGGYSGCNDANVQLFNAKEADWCADAGHLATCIDNYSLIGSGSATVRFNTAYAGYMGNLCLPSSDFLHPNNYCTTKLGAAFAGAVR